MTPGKAPKKSFTSLRIVGKHAQNLLKQARKAAGSNKRTTKDVALPAAAKHDEFVMHLSLGSIVSATFAIVFIALGFLAVYHLRDKIIILLLGLFVAAVVDPGVSWLEKMRIPRGIAILIHYVIALFIIFFLLFSLIPIIATQIQQIATIIGAEADAFLADPQISVPLLSADTNLRLTTLTQSLLRALSITEFSDALQRLGQNLSTAAQGSVIFVAQLAGSVVNFFITLIIVLVFAFFIQIEKERIFAWTIAFLPVRYRAYMNAKAEAVHWKIAQWVRGELLLMLSIFSLTLIALLVLRMPYALTLAVLAGFCEFLPAVGPFIAAVPAVIIAFSQQGFVWALIVAGVYYVIQWCENNLLVPLIMKRAVGLSPIAILFAMLVGVSFPETIHPVVGVALAIPITTIITIFLDDWRKIHDR
jgi:predicted PurR-regulated permease PerM